MHKNRCPGRHRFWNDFSSGRWKARGEGDCLSLQGGIQRGVSCAPCTPHRTLERLRFCGARCAGGREELRNGIQGIVPKSGFRLPAHATRQHVPSPSSGACSHKAGSFSLEVLNQKDSEHGHSMQRRAGGSLGLIPGGKRKSALIITEWWRFCTQPLPLLAARHHPPQLECRGSAWGNWVAAENRPEENAIWGPTLKSLAHHSVSINEIHQLTSPDHPPQSKPANQIFGSSIWMDIRDHLILEESLWDERNQNHSSMGKDLGGNTNKAGEQNKASQMHKKHKFNILREIRGRAAPIYQKQDVLIQERSKNKKEEFLEIKNRRPKKRRSGRWSGKIFQNDEQKDRDGQ